MMGQLKNFSKDTFKNTAQTAARPRSCIPNPPTLEFVIQPDGSVSDVVVLKSSGATDVDEAAVSDASRLAFTSPTRLGVPIAVKERWTLKQLTDPPAPGQQLCPTHQ
jgi:TonB family protein